MKKHFDFTLTGKQFLPVWLVFYILIILPYGIFYGSLPNRTQPGTAGLFSVLLMLGLMLAAYLIMFYMIKIIIEGVKYSDHNVKFEGKFGTYLWKIISGFVLSVVTLSIYMAWFIKDLTKFIVNNSSVDDVKFEFLGKGGRLFLLFLLSLYLPLLIIIFAAAGFMMEINQSVIFTLIYQLVVMILMVPYMYLFYKWMFNVKYKDYQIKWQTEFGASCAKILVEMLLLVVTLGVYFPLFYMRLYQYFANKTIAEGPDRKLRFGYEQDAKGDFLFIWGQTLLTIVTLGIYFPWAYSKVGKRILTKTFVESVEG
jgi:uncharacterized membrane protein YjgN (DUF898 family)